MQEAEMARSRVALSRRQDSIEFLVAIAQYVLRDLILDGTLV